MALCKFLKGDSSRISTDITPFHEGWVYVTKDGYMYIDLNLGTESSPNNQRVKLNASDAETLFGASLSKIMNSSDGEIPTSKAVMDELKKYALASHNHDDVYYTEDEIDSKISTLNTEIDKKSDTGHNHVIGDVTNLQSSLDSKVPASRKINNKELTADITLSASDVGAAASTHDHNGVYSAVGHNHNDKYYTETEVNTLLAGKANATHTHSISDVEELQATLDDKVNTSTMVNGKALNTDVVLTPSDIAGAATTTDVSNAKKEAIDYTDQKIANLLNNTTPAIDSITELAEAMQDNADAIEALKEIAAGHADADHTHDNYASSVTVTGSGNAITAISQTGNKITATKGSTFLTAHPTITKTTDSTSAASPKHGESFTAVDSVTRDGNGHVTKINTKTVTLPSETSLSKGTDISGAETLKHGGSFTVVTDTSVNGHVITDNNTTFTLPSETTLTKGTDATATKTLEYGKTFTAVTDTAVSGHKITDTTTTFTMPSVDTALSDTSANPVQNKVVKTALDGKADKSEGVLYIEGTGTTDTTNKVATWIGSHDDITEYFAGLTILYKIGTEGSTTTTLNINGLGAVKVVRNATTSISTAIPVNGIVLLTYTIDSDGTAYWKTADYDSNTKTTAGTSNKTGTKLYLAGATSQSSSGATTYSNKNVYIGTDNSLYSNGTKVSVEGHTHNYAGSQSAGGSANSAVKLDASGGSATQPVYFKDGQPVATTYALNKTVPADAVFTDTTYGEATTSAAGLMSASDKTKLNGIASGANKYTHPSYTAKTGVPTANQTPAFGGTFQVTQPVSDATGHIVEMNSRTVTIPKTEATTSAAGLMSAGDKAKLSGIATGAEVNQNAFSNVTVGNTTIAADSKTDTLTFVAGDNVTLTPDATNDKITISAKDTTYTLNSFGVTATATELNVLDGITATTAELNYVDGVTSNIQAQLNNKVPTTRTVNGKALSANISLSASDVGADAFGTASNTVSTHNTNSSAHNDIRLLITNLTDRLDAVANSTDKDLDQLSEIVAYIKSNKELIDAITTSKVSVSDIINNLTTNVSNKPLSAAQGVALKKLIDEIVVPTKVSELTNDSGYLTEHPKTEMSDLLEYVDNSMVYGQDFRFIESVSIDSNGHITSLLEHSTALPTVDKALSSVSTNPVQNKVVTEALNNKVNTGDLPGVKTTGNVYTVDGVEITAQSGAEIFNDYPENIATGAQSHAEGSHTIATGIYAHAEGYGAKAYGEVSHSEGKYTKASGAYSHAEGRSSEASGIGSHAEGYCTTATADYQHVQGKLNIEDTENRYAHIVGNGYEAPVEGDDTLVALEFSNAHTLDWEGNAWFAGDVRVGGTGDTDTNSFSIIPKTSTVTLPSSSWNTSTLQQSVAVAGVLADQTKQIIHVTPDTASMTEYCDNGVMCIEQQADTLVFSTEFIPSTDLTVYITIQGCM